MRIVNKLCVVTVCTHYPYIHTMSSPNRSTVDVMNCSQLININGWTFLSHDTAGWNEETICFKSSVGGNYWAAWVQVVEGCDGDSTNNTSSGDTNTNDKKYQLHTYNFQQNPESLKIKKKVDCLAEVMRYVVSV